MASQDLCVPVPDRVEEIAAAILKTQAGRKYSVARPLRHSAPQCATVRHIRAHASATALVLIRFGSNQRIPTIKPTKRLGLFIGDSRLFHMAAVRELAGSRGVEMAFTCLK